MFKKLAYIFDAWLTGRHFTEDEFMKRKLVQLMRKRPIYEGEAPWAYDFNGGELKREDNPAFFNEVNPEEAVFRIEKGENSAEFNLRKATRAAMEIDAADRRRRELHDADMELRNAYRDHIASMPHLWHLWSNMTIGVLLCTLLSVGELSLITATLCDQVFGIDTSNIWRQPRHLVAGAVLTAMGIFALQVFLASKLIQRRPS